MRMFGLPLILSFLAILNLHVPDGSGSARASELRFYNWADYIDPELLTGFTEETGIGVTMDTYTEADIAEAHLLTGGTGLDLAVVSVGALPRLLEAGAIQPFDRTRFSRLDRLDAGQMALLDRIEPDAARYTLPYLWGTTGLAMDEVAVRERLPEADLESWDLLFNPEHARALSDCGIGIVDSVEEVLAAALSWLGRDPVAPSDEDVADAFAAILAISPFVKRFDSSNYDDLVNGDMCIAMTWNSEGFAVEVEKGEESAFRYVMPKDGTVAWFDVLVIPSDAANTDAAYSFVEFIYDPERMAAVVGWGYSASVLPEAHEHLDEALSGHPTLFPAPERIERMIFPPRRSGVEKAALDRSWRRAMLGM